MEKRPSAKKGCRTVYGNPLYIFCLLCFFPYLHHRTDGAELGEIVHDEGFEHIICDIVRQDDGLA